MLDGHAQPRLLAKRAAELGMTALTISDHGNIFGWQEFYEACLEFGIKPLLGTEAYQARKTRFDRDEEERSGKTNDELVQRGPYHLTIIARNLEGYQNLIKLSSRSFTEGFYVKPRIDFELLEEHSSGLTVLSGCLNGIVQRALLRDDYDYALSSAAKLQDIVGRDHFFIEIQDHGIEEQARVKEDLLKIAKTIAAPIVPTGDCHYVRKEDAHSHDIMLCIQTGATIDQENRFKFHGPEFYVKSYDEMATLFPDEWLANTLTVAEQVDLKLEFGELHFPDFPIPTQETTDQYLERNVWAGIKERYGDPIPDVVRERTEHELRVVRKMGFQSYFLVVSDIVNWAKSQGIRVGWGRGSAAGSILSYALRITNLEPLRFGLLFERFLVEGRKSMPDIDLDFDDRYRDKVIDYARNKYGSDRVAHIITFSGINTRSAIKDAGRVLGYEYSFMNKLVKLVPPPVLGVSKTLEETLRTPDMAAEYNSSADVKEIIDAAMGLEGVVRQTGIHAAGVVIAKQPLTDFIPVMRKPNKDGSDGPLVTQWSMDYIDKCGQLKIDFLGIRNLGVIDMCVEYIKLTKDFELDVDAIPLDDPGTYEDLRLGHTVGVFQLESSGMRDMAISMKPDCIEDIMAIISLYRPGPMGSDMDKMYVSRKNGRERVDYYHPALNNTLNTTYGIMLYQEDVLAVSRQLADFSAGEADDLRKAIGKKQMDKIGKFRGDFVNGAIATHKVPEALANKIYTDMEYFGGYGFNRAHAASYAMISYVTAYLKHHYPAEYMAAVISSVANKPGKAAPYLSECRRLGITVSPPSINQSEANFKVLSDEEILFGLFSIRGVGPALVEYIVNSRSQDYTTLYDFMRRCNPEVLTKSALEHLINSGALDELELEQVERLLSRAEKIDLLDLEKYELGLYVSDHPLLGVWNVLQNSIDYTLDEVEFVPSGEQITVAGLLSKVEIRTTKRGEQMARLTLEDLTGAIEVMVFPKELPKHTFVEGDIVIIEGRITKEGDEDEITKLFLTECTKPVLPDYNIGEPIVIRFPEIPSRGIIEDMTALIEDNPGDSPVYVEFIEGAHVVSIQFKKPTSLGVKESLEFLTLKERIDYV